MENIRKNVEEGIEYLRTHAHLTHPTAVMPSEKALLQLQKQANQLTEKPSFESTSPDRGEYASQENPSLQISKQSKSMGQSSHASIVHNQSNSKKHKIDKPETQWQSHKVDNIPNTNGIDYHSKDDNFEYEFQNDGQNNENVHPNQNENEKENENQKFKTNEIKLNKSNSRHTHEPSSTSRTNNIATMKTINSIVTSINAAVSKKLFDQAINNSVKSNLNGNSNATKPNLRSQSNSNSKIASHSQSSNEQRTEFQGKNDETPVSSVASLVSHAFDPDSREKSYTTRSNVKHNINLNNQFEPIGFLSPNDELNDEQPTNDESVYETNSFPFDANYEQTIALDEKTTNTNDVVQQGIFRTEDIDLDDLDEISRNNRLNLKRGRDLVTKFLQIVESQHLLGANCTAGTALNLGEGVVDRYAQDRFRVEANVAVNRANMLTR